MRNMSEWTDFAGKPARFTGLTDTHRAMAKAPEWAYCTAERFVRLLDAAQASGQTLATMQGEWDYPAWEEPEML